MTDDLVSFERIGGVALVTLNDPRRRNVLTAPLVDAIAAAMRRAEQSEEVRCVVLTGAGSAFCAGADLNALRAAGSGDFEAVEHVYLGFLRVRESPLPTIAAVNGPAVGAGFNLALACDVRLASPAAVFDTRFAALRLHPGGGHAWMLARAVGPQRAMLAALFGQVWSGPQALAAGLVAEVVEADALVDTAVALGRVLEGQDRAYVERFTATVRAALSTVDFSDALAHETVAQRWSATRPAFHSGLRGIEERINRAR